MSAKNTIETQYDEIVEAIAEKAIEYISDDESDEKSECINDAIADYLIYYDDQAIVMAQAIEGGFVHFGRDDSVWQHVDEMLLDDVVAKVDEMMDEEASK